MVYIQGRTYISQSISQVQKYFIDLSEVVKGSIANYRHCIIVTNLFIGSVIQDFKHQSDYL